VERTFHNLTDNIYAGPPSDKLDAAWDALLGNMNLRVTSEELQQYDQSSVALPEGGGYLAWLGSIHEIHCIVSTLQALTKVPTCVKVLCTDDRV
jgi:hypothetical protein